MQDLLDEFRGLVSALEEAGVDFAVCGGLAVAVYALSLDLMLVAPARGSVWQGRERVEWEHGSLPVVSEGYDEGR